MSAFLGIMSSMNSSNAGYRSTIDRLTPLATELLAKLLLPRFSLVNLMAERKTKKKRGREKETRREETKIKNKIIDVHAATREGARTQQRGGEDKEFEWRKIGNKTRNVEKVSERAKLYVRVCMCVCLRNPFMRPTMQRNKNARIQKKKLHHNRAK